MITAVRRCPDRARRSVFSPRWERPALAGLLVLTGLAYLWDLGASGWANAFYSAAAQAGSVDWTAFFYGSSDAANSITVDKPPASIWIMALSVRLFGLSSWSILLPQAAIGVASVWALYATVRRRFSAGTALWAGGLFAVTPVAALMFRFNNPDALLVLLLIGAAYFTVRGLEDGRLRWVLAAGTVVGLAFLTKQLQAFLVLPALAAAYLCAAPPRPIVRLGHTFAALGAVVVAAGWWVAIVELVPSSARPYIGGSQYDSFLELTLGYNGLGRLTGDEVGSVGPASMGEAPAGLPSPAETADGMERWGTTGLGRLFDAENGGQIAWLLPAALLAFVVAMVVLRRAPRTSVRRGTVILFGGWLAVTGLAFSFMAGIFHAYYTVALAPAIAALVAIGGSMVWERRARLRWRILAASAVAGTGLWSAVLLSSVDAWPMALPWFVLVLSLVGAAGLVLPGRHGRVRGRLRAATVTVGLIGVLAGPLAYTGTTIGTPHSGAIVTAGPPSAGRMGAGLRLVEHGNAIPPGASGNVAAASRGLVGRDRIPPGPGPHGRPFRAESGFSMGALLGGQPVSQKVAELLAKDAETYRWMAAAVGSNHAAGYQLATGHPVMPVGGFNGSDPSPTLAEFRALVAHEEIHWFIGGGFLGQANGGSRASSEIAAWVAERFPAKEVDGVTLYDLTA